VHAHALLCGMKGGVLAIAALNDGLRAGRSYGVVDDLDIAGG